MQEKLDQLFRFMQLIYRLQQIQRRTFANGEERRENDAEHQYQLAMVAWYLCQSQNFSLDVNSVIRYALAHDVVEAYAGDVYFYGDRTGKEEREKAAAVRIEKEFPEFGSLHEIVRSYEKREDAESQFVCALDKLLPVINIYLDNGRTWKDCAVTRDMLESNKAEKIATCPEVKKYYDQIVFLLRERESELFGSSSKSVEAMQETME